MLTVTLRVAIDDTHDSAGLTDALGEFMRELELDEDRGDVDKLGLVPDENDPGRYDWSFSIQ